MIELYTTNVTGLAHSSYKELSEDIEVSDVLELVRDPQNQYDSNAIRLMYGEQQIGWVQNRKDEYSGQNVIVKMLDAGLPLYCEITAHNPHLSERDGKLRATIYLIGEDD